MFKEWNQLPDFMRIDEVRPYYESLKRKLFSMYLKRGFDLLVSAFMLVILSPAMIAISIAIVVDSQGGAFFRQERITQYGKKFKIFKFRTMVANAEKLGTQITVKNDMRITKIGAVLRKYRIDELPQLINILLGDMSFVGTRPEAIKYVKKYSKEMYATLLLPAGVTSLACIYYKDEAKLLNITEQADKVYIEEILPEKMYYNLKAIKNFSFWDDIRTMFMTVFAVLGKEYKSDHIVLGK
ncbi:sugar transferase [Blautia schinkii]|nr:sugar transferase [Blautia schinkii]